MAIEGNCLCGETKIKIVDEEHEIQVLCHCNDCKQTSGSGFTTNILAKDTNTTITGPTKAYISKAASDNDVTHTFCTTCGSSISHKSIAFGESSAIQTGNLLDHFKKIKVGAELFTKDRWVAFEPISGAAQKEIM